MKRVPVYFAIILLVGFITLGVLWQRRHVKRDSLISPVVELFESRLLECPDSSEKIRVPGADELPARRSDRCIKPSMIVVHFTVDWLSTLETLEVLNERRLSCHLAVDNQSQIQMLDFYEDRVERSACVQGYNSMAINTEISGENFDEVLGNPNDPKYDDLVASTDKALTSTCWMMKQYKIHPDQIYGHHELDEDKEDPGPKYIEYFRARIKSECKA